MLVLNWNKHYRSVRWRYARGCEVPWGEIMAPSVMTVLLVMLIFIFQRHIVGSLTAGVVKG